MLYVFFFSIALFPLAVLSQNEVGTRTEFHVDVAAGEKRCFGEDIAEQTLFSIIITAEDPTYELLDYQLVDPDRRMINKAMKRSQWKVIFTAANSGDHQICIKNRGPKDMKVLFQLLQDIDMAYVSSLAAKSTLPLWADVISLTLKAEHVRKMASTLVELEDLNFAQSDKVFDRLMLLSVVFVVMSITISFFSIKYLKEFFRKKKLI